MDYKKKYEEAIERLKQRDREHPNGYAVSDRDEFIFPELRENKNEKVKKSLIRLVKSFYDVNFPTPEGFTKEQLLSWLEKQGEQKYTKKDVDDAYLKGICDAKQELEKQEQKPAAWSEEDERKKNKLIWIFEEIKKGANYFYGSDVKEIIDWLKSLRPQTSWKPSDEQIEALESATENCAYSEYQDCLRELIEQLKKLMVE